MSDRLQSNELVPIGEDDPAQRLAVYLAFEDDLRPSLRDRAKTLLVQDRMTNRVRVDGPNASLRK